MPSIDEGICEYCGKFFRGFRGTTGRPRRFCSLLCANKWQMEHRAKINIGRLKKQELVDYNTKRCRHGYLYNEHSKCFLKEYLDAKRNKIGFLDIETFANNFMANRGIILSYAIKIHQDKKIYSSTITKKELFSEAQDKAITQRLINDMQRFDTLITYYGTCFDIPTIRTRALRWKLKHPFFGYIQHKDVFYMIRAKLNIGPNSLEEACKTVLGKSRKVHYSFERWVRALQGNKKALAEVLNHNKQDVLDLEDLYNVMIDYVKGGTSSI